MAMTWQDTKSFTNHTETVPSFCTQKTQCQTWQILGKTDDQSCSDQIQTETEAFVLIVWKKQLLNIANDDP